MQAQPTEERRVNGNLNVWYDYDRQCWIVAGVVYRCAHPQHCPGCYACQHAGEPADRRKKAEE